MNLYVGNLAYGTTEDELREAFARFGSVTSAKVITDKYTGRSRGFGFVEMGTEDEGRAAIAGLNGLNLGGREISVSEARPKQDFSAGASAGAGAGARESF
jgi:RNA recognition motif-containing protein